MDLFLQLSLHAYKLELLVKIARWPYEEWLCEAKVFLELSLNGRFSQDNCSGLHTLVMYVCVHV